MSTMIANSSTPVASPISDFGQPRQYRVHRFARFIGTATQTPDGWIALPPVAYGFNLVTPYATAAAAIDHLAILDDQAIAEADADNGDPLWAPVAA